MIEHMFVSAKGGYSRAMDDLPGGIKRVTTPLPMRPGHVHAYLLPGADGWTLVDTGLGLPDVRERWTEELAQVDGPVARSSSRTSIPTTSAPPPICGAHRRARLSGRARLRTVRAGVGESELAAPDRRVVSPARVPGHVTEELVGQGDLYRPFIRFQPDPTIVEAGAELDGWKLVAAPGHADGQLVLFRDGVLIAADHVLDPITPTVGLWPASRPDPLGDYLDALARTIELEPSLALPGPRRPDRDPVGRAPAVIEHHHARLDVAAAALSTEPMSAYAVSYPLFGDDLKPGARRFAVAETLSHLERLVREERAVRGRGRRGCYLYSPQLTTPVVDADPAPSTKAPGDGA